jgi:hypothetical protein
LALSLLTSLLKNASSKRPQDETLDWLTYIWPLREFFSFTNFFF